MIGTYALNGYDWRRDCDAKCSCGTRACDIGYTRGNSWTTDDIIRITGWINLLKGIELKVTPDVVAVYLIATRQVDFLYPMLRYKDNSNILNSVGYGRSTIPGVRIVEPCGYNCPIARAYESDRRTDFPQELFKMADNYMRDRFVRFVDAIFDVISETGSRRLEAGMRLPIKVQNALKGFTPIETSINTIINSVRSLYASMMPSAAEPRNTEGYHTSCCINKYPSLKWDPTVACSTPSNGHFQIEDDRINGDTRLRFASLCQLFNNMRCEIGSRVSTGCEIKLSELNMYKEVFCLIAEMIMYIDCYVHRYNKVASIHLPEIDQTNKLILANKLEKNGSVRHKEEERTDYTTYLQNIYAFRNVTPAAAICLADGGLQEITNLGWRDLFQMGAFEEFLNRICPQEYGEVITFLINEYPYMLNAARFISEKFEKIRKGGCCHG